MKKLIDLLTKILLIFTPKRFAHLVNYETVSYLFFGGLTTLLSFVLSWLFYNLGASATVASALADVLAIIFAYVTNKLFVFESKSWRREVLLPEAFKFGASRALTLFLGVFAMWLLVDVLDFNFIIMRFLTIVIIQVIGNYVLSKWVVFTARKNEEDESEEA